MSQNIEFLVSLLPLYDIHFYVISSLLLLRPCSVKKERHIGVERNVYRPYKRTTLVFFTGHKGGMHIFNVSGIGSQGREYFRN